MRPALLRRLLAGFALALAGSTALAAEGFAFGLFGDTPYNGFERRHLPLLLSHQTQMTAPHRSHLRLKRNRLMQLNLRFLQLMHLQLRPLCLMQHQLKLFPLK